MRFEGPRNGCAPCIRSGFRGATAGPPAKGRCGWAKVRNLLVDVAKVYVKAGNGGNGAISFRREKFVPKGGPDGGDGGRGGDVVVAVDSQLETLLDYKYRRHHPAGNGGDGGGGDRHGKDGSDCVIPVPPGTIIKDADTGQVLADMVLAGESCVIARGGKGGRGNSHFATSTNRVPRRAEPGQPGEARWVVMELRLIADVGIVGMPNAGKSTLLGRCTGAKPKVADYPFTTLRPNLGVADLGDDRRFIMADLPGLIEGAHSGHGLGLEFLRHAKRTKILLHLVDGSLAHPEAAYEAVSRELGLYDEGFVKKRQVVAVNKIDLPAVREKALRLVEAFSSMGFPAFAISAATGEGVAQLMQALWSELAR